MKVTGQPQNDSKQLVHRASVLVMFMLLTFNIDVQQFSAAILILNLHRVANCDICEHKDYVEIAFQVFDGSLRPPCGSCLLLMAVIRAHCCSPPALPAGVLFSPGQRLQI